MAFKAVLVLCASALFVQSTFAQCLGSLNAGIIGGGLGYGNSLARAELNGARLVGAELAGAGLEIAALSSPYGGCGYGLGLAAPAYATSAAASGGGLAVSSSSPIAPSGISVVSENAIEGALEVAGQLPVLAAVALEGNLPTSGAAGVTYSCGNGNVGIASESLAAAGLGYSNGLAGLNAGLAGGLGYGNAGLARAGLIGAEIAGAELAGARLAGSGCGCGRVGIY